MAVTRKKEKVQFVCQSCGYVSPRWLGRCGECQAWNSLVEERVAPASRLDAVGNSNSAGKPIALSAIDAQDAPRIPLASDELNRVLGGGLVRGSIVLLGGDPGVGKSTLLLQEAATLASPESKVLYVSGEESNRQTRLRADRLDLKADALYLLAETDLDAILAQVEKLKLALLIIDSIQTVHRAQLESAPGSISQVRECAMVLMHLAKRRNIPVILVGHVTKEGYLAGPKVLEHMVDTLLQFEGDRHQFFRILRPHKNRFGSTREIGIFEMLESGLRDVRNPSEIFLAQRSKEASGSGVVCTLEGTRPILVEVQALATAANYGTPQRTATGFDGRRLSLLLAVLEKRIGLRLGTFDVFLNVAGGVRLDEPAVDLGVASAIASSLKNQPIAQELVLVGEVGLTGELRYVPNLEQRLAEAAKLGFSRAVVPAVSGKKVPKITGLKCYPCERLEQAFEHLFG